MEKTSLSVSLPHFTSLSPTSDCIRGGTKWNIKTRGRPVRERMGQGEEGEEREVLGNQNV